MNVMEPVDEAAAVDLAELWTSGDKSYSPAVVILARTALAWKARAESDRAEIARLKAEVKRLKDAAAVVSNTLNDIRGGFHASVDPSRWVDEVRAYLGTGRAR